MAAIPDYQLPPTYPTGADYGSYPTGDTSATNGEELNAAGAEGGPTSSMGEALENYEMAQNDVVKDKGASIFELLSKRYLLSYPKILRKTSPTPEAVPSTP